MYYRNDDENDERLFGNPYTRGNMSQADEDEVRWLMGDFDDRDPSFDGGYYEYHGHSGVYGCASLKEPRRAQVEVNLPGSVELQSLEPGETFRFVNAVNGANVYMVIQSSDLDDTLVHYTLLNTGRVYHSHPTKCVMQVDVRIIVDDARTRGRV